MSSVRPCYRRARSWFLQAGLRILWFCVLKFFRGSSCRQAAMEPSQLPPFRGTPLHLRWRCAPSEYRHSPSRYARSARAPSRRAFPSTRPRITISRALMSAFTLAFGPTVSTALLNVTFPSTFPSMNRSSLPVISPLIRMPWLKHATAFEEVGTLVDGLELAGPEAGVGVVEFTGPVEISFGFCGRPSSFRHIRTPRRLG